MFKKFYYMSIASGLLLVFNNMSLPKIMGAPETQSLLHKVEEVTGLKMPQLPPPELTNSELNEQTESEAQKQAQRMVEAAETTTTTVNGVTYKIVHDSTTGIDWVNDKPYVAIQGQYHAYRNDQTYMVNGMKYLHRTGEPGNGPNLQAMAQNRAKTNPMALKDPHINPSGFSAMKPGSLGDTLKTLRNAQKRMAEQQRQLNQIMDDM